jgi:hypothetical protein
MILGISGPKSLTYIDKVMGDMITNGDNSPFNNRSEVTNSFNQTTSEAAKIIKEIERMSEKSKPMPERLIFPLADNG